MVGPADLRASSGADDPDPAESIRRVHAALAELRRAADGHRDRGRTGGPSAFADGAQLVVYNLTATLMAHLAVLRGVLSMPISRPPTSARCRGRQR